MKNHRLSLPIIALGVAATSVFSILHFPSDHGPAPTTAPLPRQDVVPETGTRHDSPAPISSSGLEPSSPAVPPPAATTAITPPPAAMVFAELARHGDLQRQERRRFEAQKWEVDLAKALDLPPNVRLERRSGLYRVAGFKYPLVRVDRVYRMDRAGAAAAVPVASAASPTSPAPTGNGGTAESSVAASGAADTAVAGGSGATNSVAAAGGAVSNGTASAIITPQASDTGLMDAGGGEVVWENALVADHLMVQVEAGITEEQLAAALPHGAVLQRPITMRGLYLVAVPAEGDRAVERAVLALSGLKGVVQFAEPDFLVCGADTVPDDPLFTTSVSDTTKQWHLPRIMAPRAWDVVKAPKNTAIANQTVVAVVDTGVDYTHPDLAGNMWINPGESGGGKETNNTDDDANGKKDDWHGWNFVENNNDPMDDVGHGTHVAGIIGAIGNNATGASGVCWGVKILPLRIIKKLGLGTYGVYSDAIAAMSYIQTLNTAGRRVAVANHSWGGSGYSLAMLNVINNPLASQDALPVGITGTYAVDVNQFTVVGSPAELAKIKVGMKVTGTGIPIASSTRGDTLVTIIQGTILTLSNYTTAAGSGAVLTFTNPIRPKSYGVVHVAAAGNSRFNSDRIPTYPATLPSGFMVCVGATDATDAVAVWSGSAGSNFGHLTVDLFAPGSSIWSTYWKPAADPAPPGFITVPGSSTQGYIALNGTSMAAPQVAATAALLRMWQPALTDLQTRQLIIENAEVIPALNLKCASNGRLNIARILDRLYQPILAGSGGATQGGGTTAEALSGATAITGAIAAYGGNYTLATRNGKVFAWGGNGLSSPIEVLGLNGITMVATTSGASYALDSDGSVWTWVYPPTGPTSPLPTVVPSLSNVVWISGSGNHVLVVKADGTVWSWGGNQYGQLGDGTTTTRTSPVQVVGLTDVAMAEAGQTHSIALKNDGTVYCWGRRSSGAGNNPLGDGDTLVTPSTTPVQVPGLTEVAYVDATVAGSWSGNGGSIVVKKDGTVWGWGNIPSIVSNTPVQRVGLSNMILAQVTGASVMTMDSDGRVAVWGGAANGNLGNGSFSTVTSVSQILIPGDQAIIGLGASDTNVYAITVEGAIYASGSNVSGRLGIGTAGAKAYPVRIPNLTNIVDVTYGVTVGYGGYAVDSSGNIFNWGANWGGTGNSVDKHLTPVPTQFMAGAKKIRNGRGAGACLFTKADNVLRSWGGFGAPFGDGRLSADYTTPPVPLASTVIDFQESTFNDYGDGTGAGVWGAGSAAAVLSDGRVQTWGRNEFGQLGNGTLQGSLTPVFAIGVSTATRVALGRRHALALLGNGTVVAWGRNDRGQFGNNTTTDSLSPVPVPGLSGVVAIGAITDSSFAIKNDGTVWSWGRNVQAGLGFLGSVDVLQPTQVTGLPAVTAISASASNVLVLAADATVWAWGQSLTTLGRGLDSPIAARLPGQVVGLSNVVQIVSGNPAFARKADGTVWGWAGTINEPLGYGDAITNLPVAVLGFAGVTETLSTLGTGSTADSWQFQNFSVPELLDDSLVADGADPDRDGISNLMEYALGLNPRQNNLQGLPTSRLNLIGASAQSESAGQIQLFGLTTADLTSGKHYQTLTVSRNGIRQDIDYVVEVSPDLQNWSHGDPFTITVLDNAETLEVYDATAMEDAPRRFMRLSIQRK